MNVLILPRCKSQFIDRGTRLVEDYIQYDHLFQAYWKHFKAAGWHCSLFGSDSFFFPARFAYRSPKLYDFLRKAMRKTGLYKIDRYLYTHSLARRVNSLGIDLIFTEVNFNVDSELLAKLCPKLTLTQWFGILPDLLSPDDIRIVNGYHLNLCPVDYDAWLQEKGIDPSTFFYASCGAVDTDLIYHEEDTDYAHDICFVGGLGPVHSNRLELLEAVAQRFDSFAFYGYGEEHIPDGYLLKQRFKGWADHTELRKIFSSCKVAINISSINYDRIVRGYNIRTLEIPACNGALQICNEHPNLNEFFEEGKEIITYTDIPDLLDKASYYLSDESKRASIVTKAYERCLAHSYTAKMPSILAAIEASRINRVSL